MIFVCAGLMREIEERISSLKEICFILVLLRRTCPLKRRQYVVAMIHLCGSILRKSMKICYSLSLQNTELASEFWNLRWSKSLLAAWLTRGVDLSYIDYVIPLSLKSSHAWFWFFMFDLKLWGLGSSSSGLTLKTKDLMGSACHLYSFVSLMEIMLL